METIDTNKVYYDFLNIDGEKRIRAYKVISIVFDIETELYTQSSTLPTLNHSPTKSG